MAEAKKTTRTTKAPAEAQALVRSTAVKKVAPAVTEEKESTKASVNKRASELGSRENSLTRTVFDLSGKEVGTVELPEEVFGAKVNQPLLLQALRVYQANQHLGLSSTKGRGEIRGGGRKPWKQKGTGRARAGSTRSPIWRGGGIVHGPVPRDVSLDLPTKMKRAALISALTTRIEDVIIVDSFKTKEPKTKLLAEGLKKLDLAGKKILLVLPEFDQEVLRASRNIDRLRSTKVQDLNAWKVIHTSKLVLAKDSLTKLTEVKIKKSKEVAKVASEV